jgi:hypothetical protein
MTNHDPTRDKITETPAPDSDAAAVQQRAGPIWTARPGREARIDEVRAFAGGTPPQAPFDLWLLTKRVDFHALRDAPSFTHHVYLLDADNFDVILAPALGIQHDDDNGVLSHLAYAILSEVPVYPATPSDEPHLVALYERLLTEGFDEELDGKTTRLKLTDQVAIDLSNSRLDTQLRSERMLSPAEIAILRRRVATRISELEAADTVLGRLDTAIAALSNELKSSTRNENALQRTLTAHPILFGTEYRRMIPKHCLGAEYEMDYALERHSGFVDLVEIEASTHPLYNANGDPRAELVHAEQQVLDWLEWMQQHGSYARSALPQIDRPHGYVVIGRRSSLTETTARKLRQRNRIHRDVLEILTYDDLLERAIRIRELLTGQPAS